MNILGLDLGITTLGVAISDKLGILASPLKLIKFSKEDYNDALKQLLVIIEEYKIKEVVLGYPKNMDNSTGFAANRSINFKSMLEENGLIVHLEDERLTTVEAINILKNNGLKNINKQEKTDIVSAVLILESYLNRINHEKK